MMMGDGAAKVAPPDVRDTRPLRVLMLSWEYPPVMVGGLGRHVHALATSLAAAGHHVTVVTRHGPDAPMEELCDGVFIVRAPEDPPVFPLATPSLLAWTMAFNHSLTRAALYAAAAESYDVIHAHDWLVTHTAVTMRDYLGVPLVATVHATEAGRHQGWLPEEMNRTIHGVEWWLGREADRIIGCSRYMRWEISRLLDLPAERIDVIPNGVHAPAWQAPAAEVAAARSRFAGAGPLLGFAGRLVYEKGAQYLVHALPHLRHRHPGLRLVIAGDGPYRPDLGAEVDRLGLSGAVSFAGFLGEHLPAVLAATDTMVVPSIYEPFGMVALEAAATGVPLAVSATGGLAEIVQPGVTGMTFPAKNPRALAEAVAVLLGDRTHAQHLARTAQSMVRTRYGWDAIAAQTAATYRDTIAGGASHRIPVRRVSARAPMVMTTHNLLADAETSSEPYAADLSLVPSSFPASFPADTGTREADGSLDCVVPAMVATLARDLAKPEDDGVPAAGLAADTGGRLLIIGEPQSIHQVLARRRPVVVTTIRERARHDDVPRGILPLLGSPDEVLIEAMLPERLSPVRHAEALLNPTAFGLVIAKALTRGVLALPRGVASEIVEHGHAGLLYADEDEMLATLHRVTDLDRARTRAAAEYRLSLVRMAGEHDHLYRRLVAASRDRKRRRPVNGLWCSARPVNALV